MQTQNFQPKRWILPQSMNPLKRRKVSNWVLHAVYHVSAYNTIRHYTTTWHFKEPIPVDQNVCHSEIPQKLDQEANKIELHSTKWKKMIWNTPSSTFPNSLRFKYRCSGKGNKVRSRFQGPKCPVQSLPLEHRDIVYTYTYAYMDCKYGRTAQFCFVDRSCLVKQESSLTFIDHCLYEYHRASIHPLFPCGDSFRWFNSGAKGVPIICLPLISLLLITFAVLLPTWHTYVHLQGKVERSLNKSLNMQELPAMIY